MKTWVAIPAFEEADFLPQTINSILSQTVSDFEVVVCVNQPDSWWESVDKSDVCINNQRTISYLQSIKDDRIHVIDKSSRGLGFSDKRCGVGWARKTLGEWVVERANSDDILVFTDGDTVFDNNYLEEIINCFKGSKKTVGVAAPYYHRLTHCESIDRAMLRYELYMRCYAINMYLINNRYAPTAIGSAISVRCSAYKSVGGITPYRSGEDFYFLQKLIKYGHVSTKCSARVYPATRTSARVDFGTGPAIIKGIEGDWSSYPIYHPSIFEEVKETFLLFETLFERDINTPMSDFLIRQLSDNDLWCPLRRNFKTKTQFIRACSEKVDGLRIFQYLKSRQRELNVDDNTSINELLSRLSISPMTGLDVATVEELNQIRDELSIVLSHLENQHS